MPIFGRRKFKKAKPAPAVANHTPAVAISSPQINPEIERIGADLLERARAHKVGLLSAKFYSDKLMDWSMKDHDFKVQLFRFVDAFPTLTTPDAVHEHLTDYLTQPGVKRPPGLDLGLKAGGAAKSLMTKTISSQITSMAQKFIAGTDAASALPQLERLWKDGIAFSVDLLGEACLSHEEADHYKDKYLDLIDNLPEAAQGWKPSDRLETDHLGAIPRANVSIKISSLSPYTDPIAPEAAIEDLRKRIDPILERAQAAGVFINFDMEQFALKDLTIELFKRCALDHSTADLGIAMQAYLKSGDQDAHDLAAWAKANNRVITVRLIKGAYWDYETIHAEEMGWPCPVWNEKWQTDACFERMAETFIKATPRKAGQGGIKLALGSHNARSIAAALYELDKAKLPRNAIELQMLHGMADQLKHAATDTDLRVREYVPVGEMIPGMAYLVRRLLENTSNESWLKAGFLDNADPAALLAPPEAPPGHTPKPDLVTLAAERHKLSPAHAKLTNPGRFTTQAMRDFADEAQRNHFAKAIETVTLREAPKDATPAEAAAAVERAQSHFQAFRDADPIARANALIAAADEMRQRRDALSAELIAESGKTWREADADVCEAIDFCDYYARLAADLFTTRRLGRFIGELDETNYEPRGVALVISPWNFPLAIATGMTAAALVTGNTTILKPAEQTPRIARRLADILQNALVQQGLPRHALQLVTGPGETIAAQMVRDPRVALIAFTGSKAVGLDIIRAAAHTPETKAEHAQTAEPYLEHFPDAAYPQPHVKKVIAEMGGKNALIIDTSADLDEAVLGARHSAFGFQGQKCSAASRIIVVDPEGPDGAATKLFIQRFVNASKALTLGDPAQPFTDVGPVIDQQAHDKITHYVKQAQTAGSTCALAANDFPHADSITASLFDRLIPRHYVAPTIFTNVKPEDPIATDEIFGPVAAVLHAPSFEDALTLALNSPYKLTGGVYSRKPAHIDRAKQAFRVGNLYINRPITGALVARQPFGGAGLSGVGSKAGGADYLLQFTEPRATTENTMRRGFAPEL
ncbi:MAG: proline dehydrogenase family protein [Planctomycetota bacterium]